jgi:hypothetical protein
MIQIAGPVEAFYHHDFQYDVNQLFPAFGSINDLGFMAVGSYCAYAGYFNPQSPPVTTGHQ